MNKYKYYGVSLTPAIFVELMIEFYDGKQFERQQAISKILEHHASKGGLPPKMHGVPLFKAATKILKNKGLKDVSYGIWRLNYEIQETIIEENVTKEKLIKLDIDKEIGEGLSSIYVYYYDIYKVYAEVKGKSSWECKIGRSDGEPIERILTQAKTSYPELPHVALIIKCLDSYQLEKAIHNILKARGKWLENAPGTEWFNTNPQEIESIYEFIYNK